MRLTPIASRSSRPGPRIVTEAPCRRTLPASCRTRLVIARRNRRSTRPTPDWGPAAADHCVGLVVVEARHGCEDDDFVEAEPVDQVQRRRRAGAAVDVTVAVD